MGKHDSKSSATGGQENPVLGSDALPGGTLSPYAAAFIVILSAVLPFLNIFQNDFVRYDDSRFILENTVIRDFSLNNIINIMSAYSPGTNNPEACPLTRVSFALNYRLHGYNHKGFQFGNLFLHALSCVLLLFLLRAGPWGAAVALWATVLFAVHPVHVESITWMTARKDVLSAALTFGAMLVYLKFVKSKDMASWAAWIISMLLWILAVYAKPSAITTPALLALWAIFFIPRANKFKALVALVPAFAAVAYFSWAQINILEHYESIKAYNGGSFWSAQFTNANILLRYLANLVAPVMLNVEYWVPEPRGWTDPRYLYSWFGLLPLAAAFLIAARRRIHLLFYPAWFIAALSPVLQLVPTNSLMADRYLYIPSVSFCLFVAFAFSFVSGKYSGIFPAAVKAASVAFATVCIAFALLTFQRNAIWRNDSSLFIDALRKNPHSSHAANNLGNILLEKGHLDEAEELLLKSLESSREKYVPLANLGALQLQRKNYDKAVEYYRRATDLKPDRPELLWNLTLALMASNDINAATETADKYFTLKPQDITARGILCRTLGDRMQFTAALPHCRIFTDSMPADSHILWTSAGGLFDAGDYRKAITVYKYFMESTSSNHGPAFVNIGICLYMLGEKDLASVAWRKARQVDTGNEKAYLFLNNPETLDRYKELKNPSESIIETIPPADGDQTNKSSEE